MTSWEDIKNIWLQNGLNPDTCTDLTEADKLRASVPVTSLNDGWYYGKWCGPGTDQNQSDKTPVDCLDLCCKLHDYFFKFVNSDQALSDSAKYILSKSVVAQSQTVGYAETISGFMFQAGSDIWRNKWYLLVTVILLLIAIAMGIGVGVIVINQNNKNKIK